MKALIETFNNHRIAQIEPDDQIFQVVPTLQWVDCPEDCQTDWSYCNGQFIPPTPTGMATEVLQNIPSLQTQNLRDEQLSMQKNKLISSRSNTMNTNTTLTAEAATDTAWCDTVCVRCYELMDIIRSDNMRTPSQEEQLVMLSVLKWVCEFAKGKTAN